MKTNLKHYLLLIMICLIVIPSASALLPSKEYNPVTKTITYYDWMGLDKVAEVTLDTPQVFLVMPGKDRKVFEVTINLDNDEYKDFIEKIELTNNYNGRGVEREITYKYKTIETYEENIPNYKYDINGWKIVDGTYHKEAKEREIWTPLEKFDLQKGKIIIGGFATVEMNDNVEWIPTWFGVKSPEFATWLSSYNVGLHTYYTMNNSLNDSVSGTINLTAGVTGTFAPIGLIAEGRNFSTSAASAGDNSTPSAAFATGTGNFTYAFWIKTSATTHPLIVRIGGGESWGGGGNLGFGILMQSGRANVNCQTSNAQTLSGTINNGAWQFVVAMRNSTGMNVFQNGTRVASGACTDDMSDTSATLHIGNHNVQPSDGAVTMDELGFWNRSLSETEISDMYNSGAGMTYKYNFGGGTTATLNSPADNYNSSSQTVTLNCSSTSTLGILNLTLVIDGINNQTFTNTTALQNVSLQVSKTLNNSDHTWTCTADDGGGFTSPLTASSRKFIVDSILPIPIIVYPSNTSYNTNVSDLNFTVNELHPGTCKYSFNLGTTNFTLPNCNTNLTGNTSIEGSNTWELYANDTFGNFNKTSVTFFKDTIYPQLNFGTGTPADNITLPYNSVYVNTTWTEVNFKNITFRLGNNITTFTTAIYLLNFTNLANGNYRYNVSVCDTVNNCNTTINRNVTIDTVYPTLSIVTPTGNYNMPPLNVSFNFTRADANPDSCWYSKNGGANISLPSCANVSSEITKLGNNTWRLYANDTAGNLNSTTTAFYAYPTFRLCNDTIVTSSMNFTTKNESNYAVLNESTFKGTFVYYYDYIQNNRTFSFDNYSDGATHEFCIYPVYASVYVDLLSEYSRAGYSTRNYVLSGHTADNTTEEIGLYMIPPAEDTDLVVRVYDGNLVIQKGIIVRMQRYYPGTNTWLEIESDTTDELGQALFHVVEKSVTYKFLLYNSTSLLKTTESIKIVCYDTPCTIDLTIEPSTTSQFINYVGIPGFAYTFGYNNNTNIFTYSWVDSSGSMTSTRLQVQQLNTTSSPYLCNTTATAASGTLNCNVSAYSGSFIATAYGTFDGDTYVIDRISATIDNRYKTFGKEGMFWAIMFLIALVLAGVWNPAVSIGMMLVGIVLIAVMGIIALPWLAVISILILGGVVISHLKT